MKQDYDLEERLLEFAVRIIRVTESMQRSDGGRYVSDQLLRSGNSPFGHHGEAEGAASRDDFIHNEAQELVKIFAASVRTAERNRPTSLRLRAGQRPSPNTPNG